MRVEAAELELVRTFFREKARMGTRSVQSASIVQKVSKATGLTNSPLILKALKDLRDEGALGGDWGPQGPIGKVVILIGAASLTAREQAWRDAVDARVEDALRVHLYAVFCAALAEWPVEMDDALIATLMELRGVGGTLAPLVGASTDLALSKVFASLPQQPLVRLGIQASLPWLPSYVMIAGSAVPEVVVTVENPAAFERAIAVTTDLPVAWIAAFGFGLSSAEAGGARLAEGVEAGRAAIALTRSGTPPPLCELLAHPHLTHWGDLDRAGLAIFHRLRCTLPQTRLSALMQPLVDVLRRGGGHPYGKLAGKEGQREWQCPDDPDVSRLLDLCAERAADQEHVTAADIRRFCCRTLA